MRPDSPDQPTVPAGKIPGSEQTLTQPGRTTDTVAASSQHFDPTLPSGSRVAGFTIKGLIASGGMGSVYLADQQRPQRTVALKLMKAGITSAEALRRFEFESHILARLSHPNIAQVYEADTYDSGSGPTPYFAMEHVDEARSITDYASEHRLGIRARVELFLQVCDAIHHGHQKGVIHRDIKPSNILVDGVGRPRVIDFGLARTTDSDLKLTIETQVGQIMGTLQYMSPEQCQADPTQLDTRSDVYSLGMVLFELLGGASAYDLSGTSMFEALRRIREQPPTRLSALNIDLRGDLETITLKAIEKEREQRYGSAEALADELRRYLHDEPIQAQPPSTINQLRRFARRNRVLVGGVAAVLLALTIGITATGLALGRALRAEADAHTLLTRAESAEEDATRRADELEVVAAFQERQLRDVDAVRMGARLQASLVGSIRDQLRYQGVASEEIDARLDQLQAVLGPANFTDVAIDALENEVVAGAMAAIDVDFGEGAELRPRLLQSVATTMREMGLVNAAVAPQEEALAIRRDTLGPMHRETLGSMYEQARLLDHRGQFDDAERQMRACLELQTRALGPDHVDTRETQRELEWMNARFGRDSAATTEERVAQCRAALAESIRSNGPEHLETAAAMQRLAGHLRLIDEDEEACRLVERVVEIRRRRLGSDHPWTLTALDTLMFHVEYVHGKQQAKLIAFEVYERSRRTLGIDAASTWRAAGLYAGRLIRTNDPGGAERVIRELGESGAISAATRETLDYYFAQGERGVALTQLGRFAEAESVLLDSYRGLDRVVPADYAFRAHMLKEAMRVLAELYDVWEKAGDAKLWRERAKALESEWDRQQRESRENVEKGAN